LFKSPKRVWNNCIPNSESSKFNFSVKKKLLSPLPYFL
jgi:hypothetical protein